LPGEDEGEIMLYSHSLRTVFQLTDDSYADYSARIDNGYIVWMHADGEDTEIFFSDGSATSQITDNAVNDYAPQISWVEEVGPVVAWQWYDGADNEISVAKYDGPDWIVTRLTDNSYEDQAPRISGPRVVWQGWDGNDYEIFCYNIISAATTQLTNNNYDDEGPEVSGQNIV
jgi:beta propeller repeat protein